MRGVWEHFLTEIAAGSLRVNFLRTGLQKR